MRSYLVLSLSFCMMFAVGCSDDPSDTGGTGGTAGSGGTAGTGGAAGMGGSPMGETKEISLGCANSSPIGAQSILSADLTVASGPVAASQEFDAVVSGTATFPESFLDAAQGLVPGGLSRATLVDLKYIVQVRSGATQVGGDATGVPLAADPSQLTPGLVRLCNFPPDQECTVGTDCQGTICNPESIIVDVPKTDVQAECQALDTEQRPTCDSSAAACVNDGDDCCTKDDQFLLNGFCVSGALDVPLLAATQTYMADASGDVLFGWADTGLSNNTFDSMTNLYTIPKPTVATPTEQGLKVNAGLTVGIECVMGVDEGEDPLDSDNTLVGLTPDEDLIAIPITE